MTLKCSGCGRIAENEADIRFDEVIANPNGDPCGSLMFPYEEAKPKSKRTEIAISPGGE